LEKPTEGTAGRELKEATFPLISEIRDLVQKARMAVAQNVNTIQVVTNFEIGRRIVEHEQQGDPKAGYGKQTIQELSRQLTEEFGRGFSKRNLEYMRRFYLEYCETAPGVVSGASDAAVSVGQPIAQIPSAQFTSRFALSWSHYVFLMNIGNRDERQFYEIEAQQSKWSLSELKRQFNTGLFKLAFINWWKSGAFLHSQPPSLFWCAS